MDRHRPWPGNKSCAPATESLLSRDSGHLSLHPASLGASRRAELHSILLVCLRSIGPLRVLAGPVWFYRGRRGTAVDGLIRKVRRAGVSILRRKSHHQAKKISFLSSFLARLAGGTGGVEAMDPTNGPLYRRWWKVSIG